MRHAGATASLILMLLLLFPSGERPLPAQLPASPKPAQIPGVTTLSPAAAPICPEDIRLIRCKPKPSFKGCSAEQRRRWLVECRPHEVPTQPPEPAQTDPRPSDAATDVPNAENAAQPVPVPAEPAPVPSLPDPSPSDTGDPETGTKIDEAPRFSIDGASVMRGAPLIFTVRRLDRLPGPYELAYRVGEDAADRMDAESRISFRREEKSAPIEVAYASCSSRVTVTLSDPQGRAEFESADASASIDGPIPESCNPPPPPPRFHWWVYVLSGLGAIGAIALGTKAYTRAREFFWPARVGCTIDNGPDRITAIERPLALPPCPTVEATIAEGELRMPDPPSVRIEETGDG